MGKFIFLFLITLLMVSPVLTAAVTFKEGEIPKPEQLVPGGSPISTDRELLNVVTSVVKWVYTIFFVVAVVFILFAAFNYLTAGGQPEKVKSSHTQLIWASVAIAIALLSVAAAQIIQSFLKP
jgi:magnesium-transporting ATPase (P-type)